MSATATPTPAAPTIRVRIAHPVLVRPAPATGSKSGRRAVRAVLAVALAWAAAALSAASYIEGWQRRHPAPVTAGTTLVRHP